VVGRKGRFFGVDSLGARVSVRTYVGVQLPLLSVLG
jgi:hypothetical protein